MRTSLNENFSSGVERGIQKPQRGSAEIGTRARAATAAHWHGPSAKRVAAHRLRETRVHESPCRSGTARAQAPPACVRRGDRRAVPRPAPSVRLPPRSSFGRSRNDDGRTRPPPGSGEQTGPRKSRRAGSPGTGCRSCVLSRLCAVLRERSCVAKIITESRPKREEHYSPSAPPSARGSCTPSRVPSACSTTAPACPMVSE